MLTKPFLIAAKNRHGIDWQKSVSCHGHPIAEVLSAVIKEIRRGKEEESLFWALEMAACGSTAEEFLWECLLVCVPEDIGLSEPEALNIVKNAKDGYFSLPQGDKRRFIFLAFVTCYLCRSTKSRYVSELLGDVLNRMESEELNPKMPDYAVDMHTTRGKALGRGLLHYLTEASSLTGKDHVFTDIYLQRLIERAGKK